MITIFFGNSFISVATLLVGIFKVLEARILEKEYRYAKIYLEIINKLNLEKE